MRAGIISTLDSHRDLPFLDEALSVAGIKQDPASGVLYHYSGAPGVIGIIGTGGIRAPNVRFLIDKSEFEFGLGILRPLLSRYAAAGLDLPAEFLGDYLAGRSGYDIFVSCFTEERDSAFHWTEYASRGTGGAIGIAAPALSRDGEAALLRVSYGVTDVAAGFTSVIDWSIATLKRAAELGDEAGENFVSGVLTASTLTLFLQVVAAKQERFRSEREWRLVHFHDQSRPMAADQLGHYERGEEQVPYVLLPLPRASGDALLLADVFLGPRWSDSTIDEELKAALAARGLAPRLARSQVQLPELSVGAA